MYDFFFAHDYVTLSFFLYLSFFSTFSVRLSVKASVCLSVCMGNLLPQVSFNPRPCQRGSCGHSCYLPATLCSLCQYCDIVSLSDTDPSVRPSFRPPPLAKASEPHVPLE